MKSILSVSAAFLLMLGAVGSAFANGPPPWYACEGRTAGDSCDPHDADHGICETSSSCTDEPSTAVNECLRCNATEEEDSGCAAARTGVLGALAVGLILSSTRRFRRRG